MLTVVGRMRTQGKTLRTKLIRFQAECLSLAAVILHLIEYTLLLSFSSRTFTPRVVICHLHPKSTAMSTRTSTRTATVLNSQKTQRESREKPKPFNKRPAKSHHGQATPAKVRKLSHPDKAARRVSVNLPAKALASALKRREESIALGGKSSHPMAQFYSSS